MYNTPLVDESLQQFWLCRLAPHHTFKVERADPLLIRFCVTHRARVGGWLPYLGADSILKAETIIKTTKMILKMLARHRHAK